MGKEKISYRQQIHKNPHRWGFVDDCAAAKFCRQQQNMIRAAKPAR